MAQSNVRSYRETLTGDGSGQIYEVSPAVADDTEREAVHVSLSGTFSGASVAIHTSATRGADSSPLDGFAALTTDAHTAAGSFNLEMLPGTRFKFVVSGSGSPVPAITADVRGRIAKV